MFCQNVRLVFPSHLVTQPVVYRMGREFDLATNIRRANVANDHGWVVLELQGPEEDVLRALRWVRDLGVSVELLDGELPD